MRSTRPILFSLIVLFLAPFLPHAFLLAESRQAGHSDRGQDEEGRGRKAAQGNCAACHELIVRNFAATAMARASGPALEALIPGEFLHQPSGVRYRAYEEKGKAWLSFERNDADALRGTRELLYFIGSGQRGRTYLFNEDGFAFESPVNWYAEAEGWDMTPAYRSVPWRSSVGMNLARLSCNLGKSQDAESYPRRVLEFNPDLPVARTMLRQLESQPDFCSE